MPTPPTPLTVTSLTNNTPPAVVADPAGVVMDAVNGNSFPNSGNTLLRVQNTSGAPVNLTIVPTETQGGLGLQSDVRVIPATSTVWVANLNPAVYGSTVTVTGPVTLKLTVIEP